jgi:hypothetical protein
MISTSNRYRYEPTVADLTATSHKATVVGIFPYWQARTRCAPSVEYLGVGARVGAYPFKKVEDQGFDWVGHRHRNLMRHVTVSTAVEAAKSGRAGDGDDSTRDGPSMYRGLWTCDGFIVPYLQKRPISNDEVRSS